MQHSSYSRVFSITIGLSAVLAFFTPTYFLYAASSVSDDLSTNLMAYYELEEDSGTRYDSHDAYDLTDNNTVTQGTGKIGSAADFEHDNNEYLSLSTNYLISTKSQAFSFSFWVKYESLPSSGGAWILTNLEKGTGAGYANSYIRESGGNYYVGVDGMDLDAQVSVATGTWYHVVFTQATGDGGATTLYWNNSSIDTGTSVTTGGQSAAFKVGYSSGTNGHDGLIDELGVWTKTLSSSDVSALYNSGNGLPYASTSWNLQTVRKDADESVTSSATLQNDDALTLSLDASTEYQIDVFLVATSTSKQPGLKVAFTAPVGADMLLGYLAYSGATPVGGGILDASGAGSSEIEIGREEGTVVRITGTVKTDSTAGVLTLQWAQYVSDSASVTVREGSYLRAEKI